MLTIDEDRHYAFATRTVKFKKNNSLAKTPTRGSAEAAGWDLYAATSYIITIKPHQTVKIGTGLSMELPKGTFGAVFARSGIATKRALRPSNCVGVIDTDYRGELIVALHNDSDQDQYVEPGERIAQLIVMPYIPINLTEVDELSETERGNGGFASTGNK